MTPIIMFYYKIFLNNILITHAPKGDREAMGIPDNQRASAERFGAANLLIVRTEYAVTIWACEPFPKFQV